MPRALSDAKLPTVVWLATTLACGLATASLNAQERPDCARPSSLSNCAGPDKNVSCATVGMCRDIAGKLTQGCLAYVCKTMQSREDQLREELKALEQAKRREEEKRRADQAQGTPVTEPLPSGGAGAGTSGNPPANPCVPSGGGADDCLGSDVIDLGIKTAPKNTDIYRK